ncbi:MAG: hypothetical protein KF757_08835 [Phycisphaeraceae bacterium]|nr:hypothetical protein [Phycisphaeraceae bacterium]MCW5762859.1 hypothetical protein [Phycisphaeraceae bacterium]
MTTLWDLLRHPIAPRAKLKPLAPSLRPASRQISRARPAQLRYETMQREMLSRYQIRVRKWRNSTSGVAWQVTYRDGTVARLIESPRPCGPVSAAVFLHEIGHHAIGFNVFSPRCLEERQAWCFALDQMEAWNLTITDAVRKRVHQSLVYAVAKARRRGLKSLPAVLVPYLRETEGGTFLDPRSSDANGPS